MPEQKINSLIIDLLHLDPFNDSLYKLCIQRFGDNNYEVSLLARFFDMEDTVKKLKNEILKDYIHRTVCITNKKAIIEFINDEENDAWTEFIRDKGELYNDIESLKEIFANLSISNQFVIRALELVNKNLANEEGKLTNEILAEMIFVNYKLGDISEAYEYSTKGLDIKELATIYCLDIKKIDDKCFDGFNIDQASVLEFKENVLIANIEDSDVIVNKKAIVELISNEENVDWGKLITDKLRINNDIQLLEKLYDDLSLNINRHFVMTSLRIVEKNIANKEGILTNDVLAEMIFVNNKLNDVNEAYKFPMKDLDIEELADKYCLEIKRIDGNCFDKFDISQSKLCEFKKHIMKANVNNSATIANKKAIVELISNEKNVDWGKFITDKQYIKRDVQVIESLYDKLNIDSNKEFVLTALHLIEKNIANKEGILTNEILAEMLYVYYKFSYGLTSIEKVKDIPIKTLELAFIADKYFLKTKIIAENCFAGFNINEIKFKNIGLARLDQGAFRNSNIKRIDALKVKTVPAYSFEGCKNMEVVDFLRNTLTLEEGVFNGCEKLQLVVLPRTVTNVAEFISDNKNICFECYDCNAESYKICTGYGWKVKLSLGAETFEKGKEYELQGKYSEAFQHFKEASDHHYIYAYEYLAKCYYNALGTEQNYSEALKYFNMASESTGNPICKHTIGFMHQNGQGTPVNIFEALNYYAEAEKGGVAWSMNAIAMIFYKGLGGNVDLAEAAKWFIKAANAGDQTAKNNIQQLMSQNPGIVPIPDNGIDDFDIKYLSRKNPSLITKILFEKFDAQKGDGVYFCNITEKAIKKFSNAIKAYVSLRRGEMPIVCFDHTIFGGAEDGCVLTNYGIYIHNDGEEKQQVFYSQIINISKGEDCIKLQIDNGNLYIAVKYYDGTLDKLKNIIQQCLEFFKG